MRAFIALLAIATTLPAQDALSEKDALHVRIVDGEGITYSLGSRSSRGITVEVSDAQGRPVEGATVSFLLPERGPTGTFPSGGRTEIAMTRPDGQALAWGMRWNRTPGPVEIRITAAKGGLRGTATSIVTLSSETVNRSPDKVSGGGRKWVWVTLAVAGAAGGAVALGGLSGKGSPAGAPPPPAAPTIGLPSITLERP